MRFELRHNTLDHLRTVLEDNEACEERQHEILGCPEHDGIICDSGCDEYTDAPLTFTALVQRLEPSDIRWLRDQVSATLLEEWMRRYGLDRLTNITHSHYNWRAHKQWVVDSDVRCFAFMRVVNAALQENTSGVIGSDDLPYLCAGGATALTTGALRREVKARLVYQAREEAQPMRQDVQNQHQEPPPAGDEKTGDASELRVLPADRVSGGGTYGKTIMVYVNGEQDSRTVVGKLIVASKWFMVTPLPSMWWKFQLKYEAGWIDPFIGINVRVKIVDRELHLELR